MIHADADITIDLRSGWIVAMVVAVGLYLVVDNRQSTSPLVNAIADRVKRPPKIPGVVEQGWG